jgi:hypothetical protein
LEVDVARGSITISFDIPEDGRRASGSDQCAGLDDSG